MFVLLAVPDPFPVFRCHAHICHVISSSVFHHVGFFLFHDFTAADLMELDDTLIQGEYITVYRIFPKIQKRMVIHISSASAVWMLRSFFSPT